MLVIDKLYILIWNFFNSFESQILITLMHHSINSLFYGNYVVANFKKGIIPLHTQISVIIWITFSYSILGITSYTTQTIENQVKTSSVFKKSKIYHKNFKN